MLFACTFHAKLPTRGLVGTNKVRYHLVGTCRNVWVLVEMLELFYTLHQKKVTFSSSIFPGNPWSGSVTPGNLTKSSLSDPGAPEEMERLNVTFYR